MDISLNSLLLLSFLLFSVGLFGLLVKKNAIALFLCVEIMLNSANLALLSVSSYHRSLDGTLIVFFMIIIAAIESVIGLALILLLKRLANSTNVNDHQFIN